MKRPKAALVVIAEPRPGNAKARRSDMGIKAPKPERKPKAKTPR